MYYNKWLIPLIFSAGMTSGTRWLHHALICYVTLIGLCLDVYWPYHIPPLPQKKKRGILKLCTGILLQYAISGVSVHGNQPNEIPALKVIFLNVILMETMKKLKHKFNHKQNA